MSGNITGLHHITAIAGDPLRNFEFYTNTIGLRFIKKTVNFDDPGTYHFYYGDEPGHPGTILTFFPWGNGIPRGRRGTGMATEISYTVPEGSLDFWEGQFNTYQVIHNKQELKFGEKVLDFFDPDGLKLVLVESKETNSLIPWETNEVKAEHATRGFHGITLSLRDITATAEILTAIFDYTFAGTEGQNSRYISGSATHAAIVDLSALPGEKRGHVANGTVHHVAFSVKDDATLQHYQEKIMAHGLQATQVIDRNYFHSVYFREPGGVLFEIATEVPGFTVDEPLAHLGSQLKLPAQYESRRSEIEAALPAIN